jgi:predicted acyltransferase
LTGIFLRDVRGEPMQKALLMSCVGLLLVVAGQVWALQFPVVKMIWTSSFVLVTGGLSLMLLAVFYVLTDIRGQRAWATVFMWVGANAIALYMINNLMEFQKVARKLVGGDISNFLDATFAKGAGSFVTVVIGMALAVWLARYLYKRKIFLRV